MTTQNNSTKVIDDKLLILPNQDRERARDVIQTINARQR